MSSPELHGTCNSNAHRILCDSPRRVNLSALPDDETEIQQTFDLLSTNAKGAWSKFVVGILDTSWYTRYRSSSHNPDLHPGFIFPQAVPDLHNGQHTAIPRTDADTGDPNFLQAIVNTAVFHFPTIEQGGNSLYPSVAQRATHTEVLRILISIGPTETMHFQT